ncbi:MAG: hypothetical protein ACI9YO_000146 [Gammaproteobacteria bacterium]
MIQFKCPHCGEKGISLWTKMWLGPGVLAACTGCEKKVSVPNKAMFAIIPMLLAILIAQESDAVLVEVGFFILGLLVSLAFHIKMTPLVAK